MYTHIVLWTFSVSIILSVFLCKNVAVLVCACVCDFDNRNRKYRPYTHHISIPSAHICIVIMWMCIDMCISFYDLALLLPGPKQRGHITVFFCFSLKTFADLFLVFAIFFCLNNWNQRITFSWKNSLKKKTKWKILQQWNTSM